jgi:hypothetical protein
MKKTTNKELAYMLLQNSKTNEIKGRGVLHKIKQKRKTLRDEVEMKIYKTLPSTYQFN